MPSSSGNIQMVLIVGVMSLVFAGMFILLYNPLGKGQAQDLISTTAFSVTENIADSIDALAATDYDGTVKYSLPNANCTISFYDNYILSDVRFKSAFGEVNTSYGLFTNVNFIHPDEVECSPGKSLLITKEGDEMEIAETEAI